MKKINFLFACLLMLLVVYSANATNYYVSSILGIAGNPGTLGQPFVALQAAANVTNPGDTVYVMNGTYQSVNSGTNQSIVTMSRSGTDGNYITYRAYPGHTPKIKLVSGLSYQIWRAVAINASYIIFDGIEIEGANGSLDYAGAYQTYQDYKNNIKDFNKISSYNCNALSVGVFGVATAHHVIVRNCKVHDAGGGISGTNCDYLTIENNTIYGTCWYSMYAGSGISILNPISIDVVTTYKMFIRNNTVYSNKTLIPWINIDALSDGNGIILDVNIGNGSTIAPYVGRYLVSNNVSYNNGGGGVHAYKAAHVDLINNTAYNNGTVVGYPEIDGNTCTDVKIYNNIMYGRGSGTNCNGNDENVVYDYNLYFNGSSYKNGSHDKTADPQFINLALDATANFQLQSTSPAINNGSNTAGQFSATDMLAVVRPVGFTSDMGAYEYPIVLSRNEMDILQGSTAIPSGSGSFDFGDVGSSAPKTVTFTIQNIGDLPLNLTGTPRVTVTGAGFSLATDAPAIVAAGGSATFDVLFAPSATAVYAGTISIANDDADENPYTFSLNGNGYDGTIGSQSFTAGNLVVSRVGDGTTALSGNTAPINLLEYNTTTTNQTVPVSTLTIPATGTRKLTIGGNVAYEGQLSLSQNNQYLSLVGYNANTGQASTNTCISNIAVGSGGSGYTSTPTINISAPDIAGGIQAVAGIQLSGGAVSNIYIITSGSGYSANPTVTITGGGGSGATAAIPTRIPWWQGFTNKKVIARIDATAKVDYSTVFQNATNTTSGSVKSAISTDGSKFWVSNSRMEYVTFGQTTPVVQVLASAGPRSASIFNSKIYYILGFNAAAMNYTNTALPTTTSTTTSVGIATSAASHSPVAFAFFDMDGSIGWNGTGYDVLYFCDVNSGIEKFAYDGTNWIPINSRYMPLASPLNNAFFPGIGLSSMTATVGSNGYPVLYVTTGSSAAANNKLLVITDNGGRTTPMVNGTTASYVTLATAGANYIFKGVAFTPGSTATLILPISITAFSGSLVAGKSVLNWQTATELNAKEFVVEKSTDGTTFSPIGKVSATNNANGSNYDFTDNNTTDVAIFYRLKLVDKDGSFRYSNIVLIKGGLIVGSGIKIFPNPVTSYFTIAYPVAEANASLSILSDDGKKIGEYHLAEGSSQKGIDVSTLGHGHYRVVYKNNGQSVSGSFIK